MPNRILPYPWQTDTCLGGWHYNKFEYEKNRYKSAKAVIHMLADIVSKNGNLLLNVPVRGDGSIDEKEEAILEGIAAWMNTNQESIFATRPWKVFGEGPASAGVELKAQGFNEGKGKPFTAEDIRFHGRQGRFALCHRLRSAFRTSGHQIPRQERCAARSAIAKVEQLGTNDAITWSAGDDALTVNPVVDKLASDAAVVFKIQFN